MATSADQRLLQLLDNWLASLELHLKYASLDAESYAQVQPWPPHQRPTRWIIDIARQKALALKALIEERVQMGDGKFSEALEMTMFLANLVGVQHIERFIPLASATTERAVAQAPADTGSMSLTTNAAIEVPERLASAVTGTREMPQFVAKTRAPPPVGTARVARAERTSTAASAPTAPAELPPTVPTAATPATPATPAAATAAAVTVAPRATRAVARSAPRAAAGKPSAATTSRAAATRTGSAAARSPSTARTRAVDAGTDAGGGGGAGGGAGEPSAEARANVLADAERLLHWGRQWYELAELIARIADRPPLTQVRRILKDNKAMLEAKIQR
jgi:hypothetical protein